MLIAVCIKCRCRSLHLANYTKLLLYDWRQLLQAASSPIMRFFMLCLPWEKGWLCHWTDWCQELYCRSESGKIYDSISIQMFNCCSTV